VVHLQTNSLILYFLQLYIYSIVFHWILLRGIQLTHVQRNGGSTVKIVLECKIFTLNEANTFVTLPKATRRSQTTVVETVEQT
jgi:hypothetical protein